jgi:hypothetical protein
MGHARRVAVALLSAVLAAQAYSLDAPATVVNADEVAVVLSGTTIFDDSFDRNITLNGGSGKVVASETNFSDGTPANYFVQGSIPEMTANNGQARFDTANGILIHQPPLNIPLIQNVNLGLLTGTTGAHALTPANTFSAVGLFDLVVPSVVLGTYQFLIGNNTAIPGRILHMRIRETDTGPVLQLQWVDNVAHLNTIMSEVALHKPSSPSLNSSSKSSTTPPTATYSRLHMPLAAAIRSRASTAP